MWEEISAEAEEKEKDGDRVTLLEAEIGDEVGNKARDTAIRIVYGEELFLCEYLVERYSLKAAFAIKGGSSEKWLRIDVAWNDWREENFGKKGKKDYADARATISPEKNGYWVMTEESLFFRFFVSGFETVIVRYLPAEDFLSAGRKLSPYNHLKMEGAQSSLEGKALATFAISIKRTPLSAQEMMEGKKRKEREVSMGVALMNSVPQRGREEMTFA
jgi:hypothetical protein